MLTGPVIILALKIAVGAVTVLLLVALWALARGKYWLHGRLNTLFTVLTLTAVVVFEGLLQAGVDVTGHFTPADRVALYVHLGFVIPLIPVMLLMTWSGWRHRGHLHVRLGIVFLVLWTGMFVTGVFFLPHSPP